MRALANIAPIWRALARHKLTVALLVAEVILTCTIVCNVVFLMALGAQRIHLATGLDEHALAMIDSVSPPTATNLLAQHRRDLRVLRAIPGVQSAAAVDALPLSGHNWTNGISTDAAPHRNVHASAFNGTPGELRTLGLKLVAGRDFRAEEYIPMDAAKGYTGIDHVTATIVTRQLAQRLFPGQQALGKVIYPGAHGARIVGIVDQLLRPDLYSKAENNLSFLLPMLPDERRVTYVMRTDPAQRGRVLAVAQRKLEALNSQRVIHGARTFDQLRHRYFGRQRNMLGVLAATCIGLLFVTALGIVGLASFWVQRRRKQIGIRRALGASRRDILRYFQIENALIMTAGIVPGVILAFVLNVLLLQHFAMDRLPLWYLAVGAVLFWIVGQLAVLMPALRASRVPPVVATRTV